MVANVMSLLSAIIMSTCVLQAWTQAFWRLATRRGGLTIQELGAAFASATDRTVWLKPWLLRKAVVSIQALKDFRHSENQLNSSLEP